MASWVHTVIYVRVGASRLGPTEVRVLKISLRKRPVHWYYLVATVYALLDVHVQDIKLSYTKFVHSNAHSCYCHVFKIVCMFVIW
jgi:hypothetical protein